MAEPPDLSSKVAVVTGAGRGVGRAISLALAARGAHVALVARSADQLSATREHILARGGAAHVFALDVTDPRAVLDHLKPGVEMLLGPPQILVNSAGVFGPIALLQEGDPGRWIETLMVNTIGSYLTCRAFSAGMVQAGWGRIINVTSAASLHQPGPLTSAYSVSKVAVNQLTRCLAVELAGTGVTANLIHPGEVQTAMWHDIKEQITARGPADHPLRDWVAQVERSGGDPPDKAADLVLRLLGDDAGDTNGRFLWIAEGQQTPIEAPWA